jgi:hypothetical protein
MPDRTTLDPSHNQSFVRQLTRKLDPQLRAERRERIGGRHDGAIGALSRPEMDRKGPRRENHGSIQPRTQPQRYLGLMLPSFADRFADPY